MNFLERLVAEWYEYNRYLVKTNHKYNLRPIKLKGGYEGEFDVLAFHPTKKELIHIEASTDANSNKERTEYVQKKFRAKDEEYLKEFPFAKGWTIKRRAIIGLQKKVLPSPHPTIETFSIPGFLEEICEELKKCFPLEDAVPECYSLLRAIQFAVHFGISK